jgi:hypothetical protein
VDAAAFPSFWRLDASGFEEAMEATPHSRFRIVRDGPIVGYAIAGRAGSRGTSSAWPSSRNGRGGGSARPS